MPPRIPKQSQHEWKYVSFNRLKNPSDPTYQCKKCGKVIDKRSAVLHKGWGNAKYGVCPGQPSSSGPQDFHMINVVAPHA